MIDSKDFIVKVLLNKNKERNHTDVTKPQIASKEGANGEKGQFFQLSLLAKKTGPRSVQGKKILFNVWNNGQRAILFDDIANALENEKYTISKIDGGAILNDSGTDGVLFYGELCTEEARDPETGAPFIYERTDINGKPLINPKTGKSNTANSIQMFILDFEFKNGTKEILFAAEQRRMFEHRIKVTSGSDNPITVDEEELERNVTETVDSTNAAKPITKVK